MSSATGIPDQSPVTHGSGEDEPLLGRAGDASQQDGKGIQYNFVLGVISSSSEFETSANPVCRNCYHCSSRYLDCMISTPNLDAGRNFLTASS